jgi:hypothetical protein
MSPDLAQVAAAWHALPEAVRAGIVAMAGGIIGQPSSRRRRSSPYRAGFQQWSVSWRKVALVMESEEV